MATFTSKVTDRGQTTLPARVREALKIRPGDTLEYELSEKGVQVKVKRMSLDEVLEKYGGMFGPSSAKTEQEALAEFRALRGRDEEDQEILDRWAAESNP